MLVSELQHRCSARELVEWGEFMRLSPDDLKQPESVEDQLLKVFGNRNG